MTKYFTIGYLLIVFTFLTANAQNTLYTETFADGTLHNVWYPGFKASLGSISKTVEPKNVMGDPSGDDWVGSISTFYSLTDTVGVAESFSGDVNWTNYYVEAWLYIPVDTGPVSGLEFFTLEFRVDSTGNTSAYQFAATFNPQAMYAPPGLRFRKRLGSSTSTIHTWAADTIPGGLPSVNGWHKMAVNMVGNQFWFFFDDQEMPGNPYSDTLATPLLNQGAIGVYAFRFNFTNPSPVDTIQLLVDDINVTDPISKITNEGNSVIEGFQLQQNYPNPFNPTTRINFVLPGSNLVQLDIYNNIGQKVRTLVNREYSAGPHEIVWDSRNDNGIEVPAGIYYYRLKAADFQQTRKMLLVK